MTTQAAREEAFLRNARNLQCEDRAARKMPSCTLEQLGTVITAAVTAALEAAELDAGHFEESKHPRATDGKFGSGGGSGSHASEKSAEKSDIGGDRSEPTKALKDGKALHALELPVKVEHAIGHAVKAGAASAIDFVRSKVSSPGDEASKISSIAGKIGGGVGIVAKVGLKAYFASWVATQGAVKAVAKAKGLSEADAARVQSICSCYDAIACKAVFLGLEHSSLKHLAGASLFIPTASVAYLAYSAARNPIATSRAAAGAVKAVAEKFKGMKRKSGLSGVESEAGASVGLLADAIKRHAGDDWFFAILPWAMEEAGNTKDAVELAEATTRAHAAPKEESPE